MKGKVKWYSVKLGYGFIEGDDGMNIFVHKSKLPFWTIFLSSGDNVEFAKEETKRGLIATDVKMLNPM